MEEEPPPTPPPTTPSSVSTVDTSRPFSSVKEAVAVFGQRIIISSSSPKPHCSSLPWKEFSVTRNIDHPTMKTTKDDQNALVDTLKRLEAELEATKTEVKMLKERESETEVAVASLNAELHKNMSKIARAEAAAAKAARAESFKEREKRVVEESPTLAQVLSLGEEEGFSGERKERMLRKKKKPIIPLVGDLFSRRKGSSSSSASLHSSLFSSTHVYLN